MLFPTIIHNSQTGFIKGRYIGENIRLLFEIIDNAENEDKHGLIFSLILRMHLIASITHLLLVV